MFCKTNTGIEETNRRASTLDFVKKKKHRVESCISLDPKKKRGEGEGTRKRRRKNAPGKERLKQEVSLLRWGDKEGKVKQSCYTP